MFSTSLGWSYHSIVHRNTGTTVVNSLAELCGSGPSCDHDDLKKDHKDKLPAGDSLCAATALIGDICRQLSTAPSGEEQCKSTCTEKIRNFFFSHINKANGRGAISNLPVGWSGT